MKKLALIAFLGLGMICLTMPLSAQEAPAVTPAPAGTEEETDIVAGKVATVDAGQNSLVVTDEAGKSYTLTVTKEETSIWKGDDTIELADVKPGNSVELEYYKNKEGKMVAIWVDVVTLETAPAVEAPKPEEAATEPAPAPVEATQ